MCVSCHYKYDIENGTHSPPPSRRGKKHTVEARRKMSEAHADVFGWHHSAETIQKMRESHLGDKNPMFGKKWHHSAETRLNLGNIMMLIKSNARVVKLLSMSGRFQTRLAQGGNNTLGERMK